MQLTDAEIDKWLKEAEERGLLGEEGLKSELEGSAGLESLAFFSSLQKTEGAACLLLRINGKRVLGIFGKEKAGEGFEGKKRFPAGGKYTAWFCPLSHRNAERLRRALPFTGPSALSGMKVTIGLGDRLGLAGAGHIRTVKHYKAAPVLAQQSVRELDLTGRSYEEVLDSSTWAVFQEGYTGSWGADGDHLKTEEWVKKALEAGFTMITADVSDYINEEYGRKEITEVMKAFRALDESYRRRIEKKYLEMRLELDTGEAITFLKEELARIVLIYGEAIDRARRLYRAGVEVKGEGSFDFELSVDETSTPTAPQAHAFVAMELDDIRLTSLAPRFVGEFQKGIDYIGDAEAFERSFRSHAALARKFGYRISVHSGSDKFRVFPIIGRCSEGSFHLKTAGTNWLEAMKVIARREPGMYRKLHGQALKSFAKAARYYHVTTNLDNIPALSEVPDEKLPGLFTNPDARQLIHITYGELLRDPSFGKPFFQALEKHLEDYWLSLEEHIGRHLKHLGVEHGK